MIDVASFMSILPYFLSTNNHFDDSIYDAVITVCIDCSVDGIDFGESHSSEPTQE